MSNINTKNEYGQLMIFGGSFEFVSIFEIIKKRSTKSISKSNSMRLFIDCAKVWNRYQSIKNKFTMSNKTLVYESENRRHSMEIH